MWGGGAHLPRHSHNDFFILDQEDWHNIMLLTGANGLAQGLGWPAVTKMIRAWQVKLNYNEVL